MIYRNIICLTAFLATLASFTTASAAPGNFAVVDIQMIMRSSLAAKSIRTQIDSMRESFQAKISKEEEELRKMDKDLATQRSLISPEAFEKRRKEFKNKVTDIQKKVQERKIKLDRAFAASINTLQEAVNGIIEKIADKKELALVIPTSQILYADKSMDITKEVMKKLDKKLPKVKVTDSVK